MSDNNNRSDDAPVSACAHENLRRVRAETVGTGGTREVKCEDCGERWTQIMVPIGYAHGRGARALAERMRRGETAADIVKKFHD